MNERDATSVMINQARASDYMCGSTPLFIRGCPAETNLAARQRLHLSAALQGRIFAFHHAYSLPHAALQGPRQRRLCWWELYLQTAAVAMATAP